MSTYYPRDKREAILDVHYGIVVNELNARLLSRSGVAAGVASLFSSSAIYVAITQGHPLAATLAGSIVSILGLISTLSGFAERRAEHNAMRKRFGELSSQCSQLSLDEIDVRLRALQSDGPVGIRALDWIAYNRNLLTHGYADHLVRLPLLSKLLRLVV